MMELIRRGKDTISLHGCSVVKPHYYKTNKKKPKAKLALSNIKNFPACSSKPCCSMMGIITSIPADL
jgi:hypothetical protein